jgi:hypothetical protein
MLIDGAASCSEMQPVETSLYAHPYARFSSDLATATPGLAAARLFVQSDEEKRDVRGVGTVTTCGAPLSANVTWPLTDVLWIQDAAETDLFFGQATVKYPSACDPISGNSTGYCFPSV